jgi:hypothetical protein
MPPMHTGWKGQLSALRRQECRTTLQRPPSTGGSVLRLLSLSEIILHKTRCLMPYAQMSWATRRNRQKRPMRPLPTEISYKPGVLATREGYTPLGTKRETIRNGPAGPNAANSKGIRQDLDQKRSRTHAQT